jgi:UDP-N-acetylglucosamine enolpyruvyl transferase
MTATTGAPDRVRVHPATLAGTVAVPGDKSVSHRCLLLGALVGDEVEVSGLAPSGDVRSTAAALRVLGADVALAPGIDGGVDREAEGAVAGFDHPRADILHERPVAAHVKLVHGGLGDRLRHLLQARLAGG